MNRYVEILDNLLNDIHNDKEKFVKDVYISTFTFADPVIVFRTFENSDNIDCLKKCMLYMGFFVSSCRYANKYDSIIISKKDNDFTDDEKQIICKILNRLNLTAVNSIKLSRIHYDGLSFIGDNLHDAVFSDRNTLNEIENTFTKTSGLSKKNIDEAYLKTNKTEVKAMHLNEIYVSLIEKIHNNEEEYVFEHYLKKQLSFDDMVLIEIPKDSEKAGKLRYALMILHAVISKVQYGNKTMYLVNPESGCFTNANLEAIKAVASFYSLRYSHDVDLKKISFKNSDLIFDRVSAHSPMMGAWYMAQICFREATGSNTLENFIKDRCL